MQSKYTWILLLLFFVIPAGPFDPGKSWGGTVFLQPESITMGDIGAGKVNKVMAVLSNADGDRKSWSAELEEGWVCKSGQPLSGVLEHARTLPVKIAMKSSLAPAGENNNHHGLYTVVLNLEIDKRHAVYQKKLTGGNHKEIVIFNFGGERKVLELAFHVIEYPVEPVLSVLPRRLDFGTMGQGQKIIKKIEITNRGRQALKWKVYPNPTPQQLGDVDALSGRYVSFFQNETRGTGQYRTGNAGKDHAEFIGHWSENDGYPEAQENSVLKYRISGSGFVLYFWKSPAARKISLYLDNQLIGNIDAFHEQTAAAEFRIKDLAGVGNRTLSLVNSQGRVVIEGIKVTGKELSRGKGNWIRIYPEIGVTTREIDYLHVSVDTGRLPPGTYGHVMKVESNGGEGAIEVFAEVSLETGLKILDVYRYVYGSDVLLSTNPEGEARTAWFRNYRKEGIAFRLFSHGAAGTTEFYRWYNPGRQLHYYSYEVTGGGKLSREYIFEGTIGNIATSRLLNTRELYRWHHPSTGHYFFTTDPKGEGVNKKGYKYDGIAGFVR